MINVFRGHRYPKIIVAFLCLAFCLTTVACQGLSEFGLSTDKTASDADSTVESKVASYTGPTGAEPRKDSDFGQLSLEDQDLLLTWMDSVKTSYQALASELSDFSGQLPELKAEMQEKAKLAESEIFQNFKNKCQEELDKLKAYAEEKLPEGADKIKEQVNKLNGLYQDFLDRLSQADSKADDFSDQLQEDVNKLISGLQDVLDAFFDFKS
ncbi:MAG: hypothetical protein Q4E09_01260 [Eubacteriales bacterium]|nr:hypothetical protein [Eubacteriales bacterium]